MWTILNRWKLSHGEMTSSLSSGWDWNNFHTYIWPLLRFIFPVRTTHWMFPHGCTRILYKTHCTTLLAAVWGVRGEGWGREAHKWTVPSGKYEFLWRHWGLWESAVTSGSSHCFGYTVSIGVTHTQWEVTGGWKTKAGPLWFFHCCNGTGRNKYGYTPKRKQKFWMDSPAFPAVEIKCSSWREIRGAGIPRKNLLGWLCCGFWQSWGSKESRQFWPAWLYVFIPEECRMKDSYS